MVPLAPKTWSLSLSLWWKLPITNRNQSWLTDQKIRCSSVLSVLFLFFLDSQHSEQQQVHWQRLMSCLKIFMWKGNNLTSRKFWKTTTNWFEIWFIHIFKTVVLRKEQTCKPLKCALVSPYIEVYFQQRYKGSSKQIGFSRWCFNMGCLPAKNRSWDSHLTPWTKVNSKEAANPHSVSVSGLENSS